MHTDKYTPYKDQNYFFAHREIQFYFTFSVLIPPLYSTLFSMSTWFNTKYYDKYNMSMQIKKNSLKNEEVDTINILHVIKKNAYRVCTQNMCINYGTMTG